jgi:hypothetical protein
MERIKPLLQMFPDAKFIFIYRNPYLLYYSTLNMWRKAILGYYSLQEIPDKELEEIVFGHFQYLNECYERDKHLIPVENLIEISYEELKADSFGVVRRIYSGLNLPDFETTAEDLKSQIESEKEYLNFRYKFDPATFKRIDQRWGKYIRQRNYHVPGISF